MKTLVVSVAIVGALVLMPPGNVKAAVPALSVRLTTTRGPVYVFRAAGVRPQLTVVYVHGYYNSVDSAWKDHDLAAKFTASRVPAVFVVPEAPAAPQAPVIWNDLPELLATVNKLQPKLLPKAGPVLAVGHSAAYRTMVNWLSYARLREVILVDALYGFEDDYAAWLSSNKNHRMVMIVRTTEAWALPFAKRFRFGMKLGEIPAVVSARMRGARFVMAQSQHGHMELVTHPEALADVLQMSRFAGSSAGKR